MPRPFEAGVLQQTSRERADGDALAVPEVAVVEAQEVSLVARKEPQTRRQPVDLIDVEAQAEHAVAKRVLSRAQALVHHMPDERA